MALWSMNDGTDTDKTVTVASGATTATFNADVSGIVAVNDVLVFDSDGNGNGPKEHRITAISDNGLLVTFTPAADATHGSGTDCWYRKPPTSEDATIANLQRILGVSTTEAAAGVTGLSHAGWVKSHTKSRGGVTSTWYETLVATSSISGDSEEADV